MNELVKFFTAPYEYATLLDILLEATAAIAGTLSIWFATKEKVISYPIGIISAFLYVIILYRFVLYGDMIMNAYFIVMSSYGWYNWIRKIDGKSISISRTNFKDKLKAFAVFLITVIFIVVIYVQFNVIDHSLGIKETIKLISQSLSSGKLNEILKITPYIDSFTSGLFFMAIYLMANKKIEHWTLWIIANGISIPLYLIKGLGFTSIQYLIYVIIAVLGYLSWKKILETQARANN